MPIVTYYCIKNHPKTEWLEIPRIIYYFLLFLWVRNVDAPGKACLYSMILDLSCNTGWKSGGWDHLKAGHSLHFCLSSD